METEDEIRELREKVERIEKTLYVGNGKPALVARAERIENDIDHLGSDIGTIKANQSWAVRLILGQIVVQVVAMVIRWCIVN